MGNDLKTAAGTIATAGTLIAAGVTFGQVKCINEAVDDCAEFTAENAKKSIVGNAAGVAVCGAATAGGAIATVATFGQWDAARDLTAQAAGGTWSCTKNMTIEFASSTVDVADGIISAPVIGHVIGGAQYVVCKISDDDEGTKKGKQRINRANRSTCVLGGAIAGLPAGPVGAITGAISGGAAYDGLDTAVSSISNGKYTPKGQIDNVTKVVNAKSGKDVVSGLADVAIGTTMDGVAGYVVHQTYSKPNPSSTGSTQPKAAGIEETKISQTKSINSMASEQNLPKEIKTVAPKPNSNMEFSSVASSDTLNENFLKMMSKESKLDSFLNDMNENLNRNLKSQSQGYGYGNGYGNGYGYDPLSNNHIEAIQNSIQDSINSNNPNYIPKSDFTDINKMTSRFEKIMRNQNNSAQPAPSNTKINQPSSQPPKYKEMQSRTKSNQMNAQNNGQNTIENSSDNKYELHKEKNYSLVQNEDQVSSNYNVEEVKYQTQSNMYNLETERLICKTKIQNLPEILKTVTLSNAEIRALIIYKVFYPLCARFVDYGIKAYAAKCLIFELAKYFSYINLSQSNLCKREVKGRLTQSQMKEAKQRAADLLSKYSGILDQYPTHIIQAVKTISSNEGYCSFIYICAGGKRTLAFGLMVDENVFADELLESLNYNLEYYTEEGDFRMLIAAVLKFEDELTCKFNKLGYRNVYKVLPNELKVVLLDMIYVWGCGSKRLIRFMGIVNNYVNGECNMDEIIKTLKTISKTHNTRMNNHANNLQKQLNDNKLKNEFV